MAFVSTTYSVIHDLYEAVAGAQTEICIFIFAICVHSVLFGKYRIPLKPLKPHVKNLNSGCLKSEDKSGSVNPQSRSQPTRKEAQLIQLVEQVVRSEGDLTEFLQEFDKHFGPSAIEEELCDSFVALLKVIGKEVSLPLVMAIRSFMSEHGVAVPGKLAGPLLQACITLAANNIFDEIMHEVRSREGRLPLNVALLALRVSISQSDFEGALGHVRDLAVRWSADSKQTPSSAPAHLLRQLARLAVNKGALIDLLKEFKGCGHLECLAFEAALLESSQQGDTTIVKEIEKLAASARVPITAVGFATLIQVAETPEDAQALLKEAGTNRCINKEVMLAAANMAAERNSASLANALISLLPTDVPSEVASALLALAAEGPLAGKDADAAVLKLYTGHLASIDLTGSLTAQRQVAAAALRTNQSQTLRKLLAMPASQDGWQVPLLKSFGLEGKVDETMRIFHALPEKTTCHYNALLDACADCHKVDAAERVMAEAKAAGLADAVTYNTILKARLQTNDLRRARATVEEMRKEGVEPNLVTFNELLNAAVQTSPEKAWGFVQEMQSLGLQPSSTTCSIILKAIQRNTRPADVVKTFALVESMSDGMDEVLLSSVCEACVRAGRADLVMEQLAKVRAGRYAGVKGPHTYGSIIRAYGCVKDLKGVWDTWREMRTRHVAPTSITLGCMVEAIVINDGPYAGYEFIGEVLAEEQTRPLVNAVIYCSVLKGFSHQKRFDRVWAVYREMLAAEVQFSIVTYNTLVDACARCQQMVNAPALLEEMAQHGIQPNVITYSTVIKGYCQEYRLDKAFELMEEMKRTSEFRPDEITYNTLLDGCARQGLYDRGLAVLQEMQDAGVKPSNFTLSVVVKLANRGHRLSQAFELCKQIVQKYGLRLNTHVYNNLMQACIAHSELKRAMEVFVQMIRERAYPDLRTYTLLLRGCINEGNAHDAAAYLAAALGLNNPVVERLEVSRGSCQIRGGLPTELVSEILEGIADQCGEQSLAVQLLKEMQEVKKIRVDPKLRLRLTAKVIRN